MNFKYSYLLHVVAFCFVLLPPAATANEFVDFGMRGHVELADGVPANDMLGFGFYVHYGLGQGWLLGMGLDRLSYDFENPAQILGIQAADSHIIDAATTATNVTMWLERRYGEGVTDWYWQAGLGVGMLDVENATGNVQGGGTYLIATEPNTETRLFAGLGYRKQLSNNWNFDSAAGVTYHLADWQVRDLNSSAVATVDNYTAYTIRFGVDYSF